MGDPPKSEDHREIVPIDIIPDILLRLPTKDFVRSSCVCKLWRSIVADPSFRKLHVAHHAATASSKPEVLLVTETGNPGRSDDASFFNVSSGTALASQVAIPCGYRLAGVCNDLLCFVFHFNHDQAPAILCNPVTGETLQLPKAPPIPGGDELSHLFVLGFSAPTKEYKMFRLSYRFGDKTKYIAVYTLGDAGGWRQSSYISRFHPVQSPAPVHIDGNLFVTTVGSAAVKRGRYCARMLVLDVAYHIPYNCDDQLLLADGFDLNGQMCLILNVEFYPHPRRKSQFWVLKPPGELEGKDEDDDKVYWGDSLPLPSTYQKKKKVYWDLCYSFYFDGPFVLNGQRLALIDHAQMLCYKVGDYVYVYDTRGYSPSSDVGASLLFDEQREVPDPPCPSISAYLSEFSRWSIYGGYRPSLLSPLVFALPSSQDEKGKNHSWSRPCYVL